ncbi:hypothetical protein ACPPVT_03485 [Angustibacter sp. McL0619]|uniref:hypothetical protein n=1 Tax=Angustibacter sp. McL0619 TaxID=3415676 RepID=UPI003CF27820
MSIDERRAATPAPAARRSRIRRRPGKRTRVVLTVLLVLLVLPAVSYVRALTYPGNASFSVRSVEWVRDHGGSPVVDAVENWYYTRKAPSAAGAPQDSIDLSTPPPAAVHARRHATSSLPRVQLLGSTAPLAGEGVWTSVGVDHAMWQTWVRPDPRHLPVVAAAVLVPKGRMALHLAAGTREPVAGAASPARAEVPAAQRDRLAATFNSGFKLRDSHGGWQLGSTAAVRLVPGRASLVIDRSGGWRIGTWGQQVSMSADVLAVRQNLDLVVDHGRPVPGLGSNAGGRWGTAHTQFQYTWRSGLGVDRRGDLIYVAGRSMTLATFAQAMARLGVVTGMQMDMHPHMVIFNLVSHRSGGDVSMTRLLSSMDAPARRYLVPDQRDFLYLTVIGRPVPGAP